MIEIQDMNRSDTEVLLASLNYGHLGCSEDGQPYVVPIHFAAEGPEIYVYTTDGKKSRIIEKNPLICLQAENVVDNENWKSVIISGRAVQVTDEAERLRALNLISRINPTMTPAISIRWMDSWVRENIEVIYRIETTWITGRATVARTRTNAPFAADKKDVIK